MKIFVLFLVLLTQPLFAAAHWLRLADSINPGTMDYLITGIQKAEADHAEYVIIQMDTPGGLLNSTRGIVQAMLNAKIPVVVFVGPKGAQAGSAGAIITLAADIAAMAPGTNIGAAHPVSAGGEKLDDTMKDKITNDTAAFAESLAKTKGRNTDWARRAVTESASIIAEKALSEGVIDLMADDANQLSEKLQGYKLRVAKEGITQISAEKQDLVAVLPSTKHKIVSFFADPNLAYLILSLGALCIWVEVTHPGLLLPGVIGTLCVLVSLVSFQMLPISYGALGLILAGLVMIVLEIFLPTFGSLAVGGLVAFVLGSLYLMDSPNPEYQIALKLIFPIAALLAGVSGLLAWLVAKSRRLQPRSGLESLIGAFGEVREPVSETDGKVFIQGELWNALTPSGTLSKSCIVRVKEVRGMVLIVEKTEDSCSTLPRSR